MHGLRWALARGACCAPPSTQLPCGSCPQCFRTCSRVHPYMQSVPSERLLQPRPPELAAPKPGPDAAAGSPLAAASGTLAPKPRAVRGSYCNTFAWIEMTPDLTPTSMPCSPFATRPFFSATCHTRLTASKRSCLAWPPITVAEGPQARPGVSGAAMTPMRRPRRSGATSERSTSSQTGYGNVTIGDATARRWRRK